ncbi:MAG: glycoside hydrolase family 13 protein [Propionibacteriaceae bacterium]|jgi:alpha-glucosidase|nr:glycoside hydrolase family 13 protein [Propionibacteriaceae bacterium]
MPGLANTANWWRHAVVYQVYPRSFMDGNGDGIGDLRGVIDRLDYLVDLGVDAIWFTPWYVSPLADGGYDVADYRAIDPRFGQLADAEELIQAAAAKGIRTIIDIVPNHVSDQHPWFQAALAALPGSPERARFWFRDGRGDDGATIPTNWQSSFQGDTWTRTNNPDGTPGQWYLHLFTAEQPDLNWTNPQVRAEHEAILRFWFDRGVAGVRIDSAALIVKDPTFPDVEDHPYRPGQHPFIDRDGIHQIYQSWRAVAESYDPPRVMVGEVWLDDPERFAAYLGPHEMNTAFNFDFMTRPFEAAALRQSINTTMAAHEHLDAVPTWVLSNHDVTRPVTRYGRADSSFAFAAKRFGVPTDLALGERRARAAMLLVAALPGSLYIYQGDELGLPEDEDLPRSAIEDPMHFRSGGVDPGRDGCRVPLPWTAAATDNFGFSTSPPGQKPAPAWLPQPAWWGDYAADREAADPESMLSLYRRSLALRRSRVDFQGPDFAWLEGFGPKVLAFARGDINCLVNLSDGAIAVPPGHVLLASTSLNDGRLPSDAACWLVRDSIASASHASGLAADPTTPKPDHPSQTEEDPLACDHDAPRLATSPAPASEADPSNPLNSPIPSNGRSLTPDLPD